jgi:hypothetical protein
MRPPFAEFADLWRWWTGLVGMPLGAKTQSHSSPSDSPITTSCDAVPTRSSSGGVAAPEAPDNGALHPCREPKLEPSTECRIEQYGSGIQLCERAPGISGGEDLSRPRVHYAAVVMGGERLGRFTRAELLEQVEELAGGDADVRGRSRTTAASAGCLPIAP